MVVAVFISCSKHQYKINTCDFNLVYPSDKHFFVKIIAIDSSINQYASKEKACLFYTACDIDKKDTFNLIDIRPKLSMNKVLSYIGSPYQLIFIPAKKGTCIECYYSKLVKFTKGNRFPFLTGELKIPL